MSLWDHCKEAVQGFSNKDDDGFVSVSAAFHVCKEWVEDKIEDTSATIYKIASNKNLVDCQATLKQRTYACLLHSHTTKTFSTIGICDTSPRVI
jgi:viroplasmin and RNaseH domain-containing protein